MTQMSTHDQACFEQWLERYATEAERELPYGKQVENHILWLSGYGEPDISIFEPTKEDKEQPQ